MRSKHRVAILRLMSVLSLPKITANGIVGLVTLGLVGVSFGLWSTTSDMKHMIAQLQSQVAQPPQPNVTTQQTDMGGNKTAPLISNQVNSTQLEASVSALTKSVASLSAEVKALKNQTKTKTTSEQAQTSFTKETIYLGSTTIQNREWTETGLEVGINSAQYPSDVTAKLEAGTSIIGGEVWVRLKNKSTGAVITVSEISNNSSSITWKTSPGFKLHSGGYTYVLEARSSSGEIGNISGARIIVER